MEEITHLLRELTRVSSDEQLFFKTYERYRRLLFWQIELRKYGKALSEFDRERYNCKWRAVFRNVERCRYDSVPERHPQTPRGYYLLRWLEIGSVLFPGQRIEVVPLDEKLSASAYAYYCCERSYIHAALIARLSRALGITAPWPEFNESWKTAHIHTLMEKVM